MEEIETLHTDEGVFNTYNVLIYVECWGALIQGVMLQRHVAETTVMLCTLSHYRNMQQGQHTQDNVAGI